MLTRSQKQQQIQDGSEELKKRIEEHPEVNWAEYLKQKFIERIKELRKFEELKKAGRLR